MIRSSKLLSTSNGGAFIVLPFLFCSVLFVTLSLLDAVSLCKVLFLWYVIFTLNAYILNGSAVFNCYMKN